MPANQPISALNRTVVAMAVVACALGAARPGRGAADSGVFVLDIGERASRRLDKLEKGELRITWREDGPTIAVGELRTPGDSDREYEKGSAAPPIDGCYLLAPFNYTTRNRLGGGSHVAGRARAELVASDSGTALRFEFDSGPAQQKVKLSLHDPTPINGKIFYLDGRQFDAVVLRARGTGTGSVTATFLDAHGRRGEAGTLELSAGDWRSTRLATDIGGIHQHHLAQLELRGNGSGTLELDDIYLCDVAAEPQRAPDQHRETTNALWVWHTSDLLAGGEPAVDELVDLAARTHVRRIYLQVPGSLDSIATQQALQIAATRLDDAGIHVLALDGAPEYALPSEHDDLLETIEEVIAYNQSSPPEARFVGVHLDVEPYLLDDWGSARQEVVTDYLVMLDAVRERTTPEDLELDVAVPFWFDSIPVHRQHGDKVERTSLTDEVLARVDSIAVMDYRTETAGSNGILALGAGELAAAAEQGRDVWIGLETTALNDQTFVRFRGEARVGLPDATEQEWWIVATPGSLWAVRGNALAELEERLQPADLAAARHWSAHAIEVPASRQTFYDLGFEALLQAMHETTARLDGHPAFAGLALHYDRPLRRLIEAAGD